MPKLVLSHCHMLGSVAYLSPRPDGEFCDFNSVPVKHIDLPAHSILILAYLLKSTFKVLVIWKLKKTQHISEKSKSRNEHIYA